MDNKAAMVMHAPGEVGAERGTHSLSGLIYLTKEWELLKEIPDGANSFECQMIILCAIFVLKFVGKRTLARKEKSSRIGDDELYANI